MHGQLRKAKSGDTEIQEGSFFMGPIPSPDLMQQYKQVDASFPDRIMRLTEDETKHRQFEEKRINKCKRAEIRSDGITRFVAPFMAFVTALGYMYLAYKVFEMGYTNSGSVISITGVAAIIIAFYRFTKNRSK